MKKCYRSKKKEEKMLTFVKYLCYVIRLAPFNLKWNACSFNVSKQIYVKLLLFLQLLLLLQRHRCFFWDQAGDTNEKAYRSKTLAFKSYLPKKRKSVHSNRKKWRELQILHTICYKLKRTVLKLFSMFSSSLSPSLTSSFAKLINALKWNDKQIVNRHNIFLSPSLFLSLTLVAIKHSLTFGLVSHV